VEDDLRKVYRSAVFYADDAFAGLRLMDDLTSPNGKREARLVEGKTRKEFARAAVASGPGESPGSTQPAATAPAITIPEAPSIPQPPFWGMRVARDFDLRELFRYINETALFKNQWQLKTAAQEDYARLVKEKFRPILHELQEQVIA